MQLSTFMTIPVAVDRPDVMSSFYAYTIPLSSANTDYTSIYIAIIAATADLDGLRMNGSPVAASNFNVVGNSSYSAARITVSPGSGTIFHTCGRPFYAYWFGFATNEGASSNLPAMNASLFSNSTLTCPSVPQTTVQPATSQATTKTTMVTSETADLAAGTSLTC
jgi:hypothetical protein